MSLNVGHPIAEQASENRPPSLSNFNSMVRIVNALRRMIFDPTYFNVTNNGDAPPVISLRIPDFNATEDFGIKEIVKGGSSFLTRINGGRILIGYQSYDAVETALSLAVGVNEIGWEYNFTTPALTIENWGAAVSYDGDHIRCRKWTITVDASGVSASITRKHQDCMLPANWGNQ